jgi:hypothetical protein
MNSIFSKSLLVLGVFFGVCSNNASASPDVLDQATAISSEGKLFVYLNDPGRLGHFYEIQINSRLGEYGVLGNAGSVRINNDGPSDRVFVERDSLCIQSKSGPICTGSRVAVRTFGDVCTVRAISQSPDIGWVSTVRYAFVSGCTVSKDARVDLNDLQAAH